MAQKAAKSLAVRNAAQLRRLHLIGLGIHAFYILLRFVLSRRAPSSRSLTAYVLLSLPAAAVEVMMELNSRPKYSATGDIVRAGDDLEAKGLTEYMFDVMYWTWGTTICAAVLGDYAWWLWLAVPVYSVWAAYRAFGGVKESLGGLAGAGGEGPQSNRQKKMDKRGGQKMQYR